MSPEPRAGRPRASSRTTLADAACELFLERGYARTAIADITNRAGVSRSSFFNYFGSKADILWAGLDARLDDVTRRLNARDEVRPALEAVADGFEPDSLALAIANAEVMGLVDELEHERAVRQLRLARAVADRMRADGVDRLAAEVRGAAAAGAVLAALWQWADAGSGRTALGEVVATALDLALGARPLP